MAREAVMTRKHYELIGSVINGLPTLTPLQRSVVADTFAVAFKEADRTFNTELFLAGALKRDRKKLQKLTNRVVASEATRFQVSGVTTPWPGEDMAPGG